MRVILCRRKASQPWELPGKNPAVEKTGVSQRAKARPGQLPLGTSFLPSKHRTQRLHMDLLTQPHVLCWWQVMVRHWPSFSEPRVEDRPGCLCERTHTSSTYSQSQMGHRAQCDCTDTSTPAPTKKTTYCVARMWSFSHVRPQLQRQDMRADALEPDKLQPLRSE